MQQDNDLKSSRKSTTVRLKNKIIKMVQWFSQSPDLNLTEMLCQDRNWAVHKQMPTNLNKLEQCCKEEWTKGHIISTKGGSI